MGIHQGWSHGSMLFSKSMEVFAGKGVKVRKYEDYRVFDEANGWYYTSWMITSKSLRKLLKRGWITLNAIAREETKQELKRARKLLKKKSESKAVEEKRVTQSIHMKTPTWNQMPIWDQTTLESKMDNVRVSGHHPRRSSQAPQSDLKSQNQK